MQPFPRKGEEKSRSFVHSSEKGTEYEFEGKRPAKYGVDDIEGFRRLVSFGQPRRWA
jgi:hypothetical protein